MSSARGSLGSPCTVTSRYEPCSFSTHCAVNSPGTLTHGVSIVFPAVHAVCGAAVRLKGVPGALRYACTSPLCPSSTAGFTHAACMSSPLTRPNIELAGGGIVDRNDPYVITQPICDAYVHSGIDVNATP